MKIGRKTWFFMPRLSSNTCFCTDSRHRPIRIWRLGCSVVVWIWQSMKHKKGLQVLCSQPFVLHKTNCLLVYALRFLSNARPPSPSKARVVGSGVIAMGSSGKSSLVEYPAGVENSIRWSSNAHPNFNIMSQWLELDEPLQPFL